VADKRSAILDIEGLGQHTVTFARRQPGASALLGRFTTGDQAYVLKLLKVPAILEWSRAYLDLVEPPYVRALRQAPIRDNAFAPTDGYARRMARLHGLCLPALRGITHDRALDALDGVARSEDDLRPVLDELYRDRSAYDFVPAVSEPTHATFVGTGLGAAPALLQEDLGSQCYLQSLSRPVAADTAARCREATFLVLIALALDLARRAQLGLDLAPRPHRRSTLAFTNVLVPPGAAGLAYVDFFGLGSPDGNLTERVGQALFYHPRGLALRLAHRLINRLTRKD
jgi:hypothetical protein